AVPLKRRQQIVDLFRGMHFGRKRIVHFVVKQITTLFADSNQRSYCFVFFFKNLRHKLLPQSASIVPEAFFTASRFSVGRWEHFNRDRKSGHQTRSKTRWAGRANARSGTFPCSPFNLL